MDGRPRLVRQPHGELATKLGQLPSMRFKASSPSNHPTRTHARQLCKEQELVSTDPKKVQRPGDDS